MSALMRTVAVAAALVLPLAACMGPESNRAIASGAGAPSTETLRNAGVGPRAAEETGLRSAAVDNTKRFEYVDLYVSLGDPTGQRQLAPYFLKSDVWTIDKFENLSDTLRHYRFRRLVGTDGKSLPEIDPLAPKP